MLEVLAQARAVRSSLEAPIVLDGVAVNIEASIGVAVMGEHAEDPDTLLRHADVALAHAKAHGSGVEVYSAQCDQFDASRLALLGEVRGALERGEFVLHYQPKIDVRTRRITGVEALVRWRASAAGDAAAAELHPADRADRARRAVDAPRDRPRARAARGVAAVGVAILRWR